MPPWSISREIFDAQLIVWCFCSLKWTAFETPQSNEMIKCEKGT